MSYPSFTCGRKEIQFPKRRVFSSLKYRTMVKPKTLEILCYTPSSEPFTIYFFKACLAASREENVTCHTLFLIGITRSYFVMDFLTAHTIPSSIIVRYYIDGFSCGGGQNSPIILPVSKSFNFIFSCVLTWGGYEGGVYCYFSAA